MATTSYLLRCFCCSNNVPILVGVYPALVDAQDKMAMCVTDKTTEGITAYPTATFDSITSSDGLSACVRMSYTDSIVFNIDNVEYPDIVMSKSTQSYYAFLVITELTNA